MVEIHASFGRAVLGETSFTGRCAQLTTPCHLYNWHLHVREWQQQQSVMFRRNKAESNQSTSWEVYMNCLSNACEWAGINGTYYASYYWILCSSCWSKFDCGNAAKQVPPVRENVYFWFNWQDSDLFKWCPSFVSWLYVKILHYFKKDKDMLEKAKGRSTVINKTKQSAEA